jgi:hypothetical protein
MAGLGCLAANGLWWLLSLPSAAALRRAAGQVAATQQRLLLRLLHANADSDYGRRYGFAAIHSVADYQQRVPLVDYADLQPWLERIERGDAAVLTADPVLLLEPTSGSSGRAKLIPYTAALKREFQAGIGPWMVRTFWRYPALFTGQAYWSISPVAQPDQRTPGGLPIGFEEDSNYLGGLAATLVRAVMAVPPQVKQIADIESFRYVTLLFLLRTHSLALISVWNPTFLALLVRPLAEWWPRLVADLAAGTLTPPSPLDPSMQRGLLARLTPAPRRAAEVSQACAACRAWDDNAAVGDLHRRLWPRLRLISCWADANAAPYSLRLARLFPHAYLQPKGLLATEAFVSFPLPSGEGAALALTSHFFEFFPPGAAPSDQPDAGVLAHALQVGQRYSVVVTTGGGLYRYQLHDVVVVCGYAGGCPRLRFAGRDDDISDWFGEKLDAEHVGRALDAQLARHAIQPEFAMLACDTDAAPIPAYTLYIQARAPDATLLEIGRDLEADLAGNVHYAYCRHLDQLGPIVVFRIEGGALDDYMRTCVARGQRAGDIKPAILSRHGDWSRVFAGRRLNQK